MKPLNTFTFKKVILPIACTILLMGVGLEMQSAKGDEKVSKNGGPAQPKIVATKQPGDLREKMKIGSSFRLPVYKPPKGIGAPGGRIGGGSRGQEALAIFALVPDHLGLTINDQPTLYWYLSQPVRHPVILTINDETQVMPILETTLTLTPRAGIHSLPLQNFNITLAMDREYQWNVSLAIDEENPSKNIVAGGRIQRIYPPEGLLQQLRHAEPNQVTAIYSEAGLWYDALASISDLIESHPNQPDYRVGRKTLLEQVDLMEVSKAEENLRFPQESSLWNEYRMKPVSSTSSNNLEDFN